MRRPLVDRSLKQRCINLNTHIMKKKYQSALPKILMMFLATLLLSQCNSGSRSADQKEPEADFQISLAQWSLHRTYFGGVIEDWQEFGRLPMNC